LRPSIGAALVCAVLVGGLASGIGAIRGSGLARKTWRDLPVASRTSIDAAGRAAVVLFGAATVLMVISLLVHAGEFGSIAGDYHGAAGEFSIVLLSVVYIPNAIVCAFGYLVGPGFAVGAGTSVGVHSVHLGAVPAFPLLAASPSGRAPAVVLALCILVVLGAGAAAGLRVTRAGTDGPKAERLSVSEQLRAAALTAAILGLVAAVIAGFAGGPAGPGRLRAVGPSPWQVGFCVAAEVGVVALVVVGLNAWLAPRRH
jgi:hypothetical protein